MRGSACYSIEKEVSIKISKRNSLEMIETHIDIVHGITVLYAAKPIFSLILGVNDTVVDKLQERRLRIVVIFAQTLEEFVCFPKVKHVKRSPRLTGADVEFSATLAKEIKQFVEIEC